MKKFKFPLQGMLSLRRQQQRQAELQQLRSRLVLDGIIAELNELQNRLTEVSNEMAQGVGGTVSLQRFLMQRDMADVLAAHMETTRVRIKKAEADYQQAVRAWSKVSADVKALEVLRDNALAEHAYQAQQVAQQNVDEFVMRRWQADSAAAREMS